MDTSTWPPVKPVKMVIITIMMPVPMTMVLAKGLFVVTILFGILRAAAKNVITETKITEMETATQLRMHVEQIAARIFAEMESRIPMRNAMSETATKFAPEQKIALTNARACNRLSFSNRRLPLCFLCL